MQTRQPPLGLAPAEAIAHAPPVMDGVDEPHPPAANAPFAVEPDVLRATATELWDAYDANEAAAHVRFGHARLLVSGAVERVTREAGAVVVHLSVSGAAFEVVRCGTTEGDGGRAAGLRRGDLVMLLGARAGVQSGRVVVLECALVDTDLTAASPWGRP